MNLICCVNEPCHFHRAQSQLAEGVREMFRIDEHRLFLMMQQRHRATCRNFYLRLIEFDIFIFFASLLFSSLRPSIYGPSKPVSLSNTHARQIVIFSLYNHRKKCSSYTQSKCCVTLYKSKSSRCYTMIESSKLVEYRN